MGKIELIAVIAGILMAVGMTLMEAADVRAEGLEDHEVSGEVPLDADLQILAQGLCEEYEVSYPFFLAVCESESNFDPEAVGDGGWSRGLMQINRCNWERYGLDASMVSDNLEIGIRILSELITKYRDIDCVLMAYKCGEARANELISRGIRLRCVEQTVERIGYWSEVIE